MDSRRTTASDGLSVAYDLIGAQKCDTMRIDIFLRPEQIQCLYGFPGLRME